MSKNEQSLEKAQELVERLRDVVGISERCGRPPLDTYEREAITEAATFIEIEVCAICGIPMPQKLWSGGSLVSLPCAHRKKRTLLLWRGTDGELAERIGEQINNHVQLLDEYEEAAPRDHYTDIGAAIVASFRESHSESEPKP